MWLNSDIMNYYFNLLQEREFIWSPQTPHVHFFSTYFYALLELGGDRVHEITKINKLGYSVLDCAIILMPVHRGRHWSLAVMDLHNRELKYLDSLGLHDATSEECLTRFAEWIDDEAKRQKRDVLDANTWLQVYPPNIPQQNNGYDCGVFVLMYADWIARGHPFNFTQDDIPFLRRRIASEIIAGEAR
jgi:sentrin-specific protease 1